MGLLARFLIRMGLKSNADYGRVPSGWKIK